MLMREAIVHQQYIVQLLSDYETEIKAKSIQFRLVQ
jgi:hypothetical protein